MSQQEGSVADDRRAGQDRRAALDRRGAAHVADRRWAIAESPYWAIVLNDDQSLLGRAYLLLKRPEVDALALTAEEQADLFTQAQRVQTALRDLWEPDHFNYAFLMNQNPQVHFHVIPRYRARREFAGGTFVDPEFGDHYGVGPARHLDPTAYDAILTALRNKLAG